MRNIAVFRSFVSIAVLNLLLAVPALAEETPSTYALSVTPLAGFLWGQGEEQVYRTATTNDLLSQLLWDMKPLWYVGTALDFSQREPLKKWGGFVTMSAKFGIPLETGSMEDRDWQTPWQGPELTNYSWHHNSTDRATVLDLAAGISIPLKSLFALRFSVGVSYLYFSWAARDGYRIYGRVDANWDYQPIVPTDPKILMSGVVISYSQDWLLLPLGISFAILPGSLFSGSLFFSAGPALRFVGRDTHHGKGYTYIDYITGGYTVEPGAEFLFSPHERVSLGLRFSWRSITADPHGKSYAAPTGGDYVFLGDLAGGLFQALDLGLSVKIRF